MLDLTECEIGRYFLGIPGIIFVTLAIFGQIAIFYAIQTSKTHRQNVCYQTIFIIGILILLQLLFQFQVFLDVLACGSISPLADIIFAALASRMTICTIELYNLILVINRIVVILLPLQHLENQINSFHTFLNQTCWILNMPIWIAMFHPSCSPIYIPFTPKMMDGCVNDKFLYSFDNIRNGLFVINFFAYIFLFIGMRVRYDASKLHLNINAIEKRILMTSVGQFVNVGVISILASNSERFIESNLTGKIMFRVVRTLYPCFNVFLIFILDKPLRERILPKQSVTKVVYIK